MKEMQTVILKLQKCKQFGTVVEAQLVERLLTNPEVLGSNPVIGKNIEHALSTLLKRKKITKKRLGMAHLKKSKHSI